MDASLLRTISLFEGLTEEELSRIFKLAKIKVFAEGNLILEEGHQGGGALYVILEGKVRIAKKIEGKRDKTITTLGPQGIFGEMSLFDRLPFSANVEAMQETRCMVILRDPFDQLLRQDLKLAFKVMHNIVSILCQRLRNTNEELVALTTWKDRLKVRGGKSA